MTSPSAICFRFFAAAVLLALRAPLLRAGDVTGRVELVDMHSPAAHPRADASGVVVSLRPVDRTMPLAVKPTHAVMTQKDKTFTPHILAITVGSTVSFPNLDPIFHNAFSRYDGQNFDLGLYAPKTTKTIPFIKEQEVRVFCNIHSSMSAMIVVLATPYFDVSQRNGAFRIAGVPAGDYELRVVHEFATEAALQALARRVQVPAEGLSLPSIQIPDTSHAVPPHQDKYGHDYRAHSEDPVGYPENH